MKTIKWKVIVIAITSCFVMPAAVAQQNGGQSASSGPPYGPGMMQSMTPEERQRHWEQMRSQGYMPGMMSGRMGGMPPAQRQQNRAMMRQNSGYGPGMMRRMSPEERQQHWEQMRSQGYAPGMTRGRMMGPGN